MGLKILFAMRDALPPFRVDVKILFGKYLFDKGISTHLVGRSKSQNLSPIVWNAGDVSVSATDGEGIIKTFYCMLLESWFLLLYGRTADIIQVRDRIRLLPAAWLSSFLWNKPFVYWVSFPIVEGYELSWQSLKGASKLKSFAFMLRYKLANWFFYKLLPKTADLIFVQSEAMKREMASRGFSIAKMHAVPMGVDLEMFSEPVAKPHLACDDDSFVLGYLGSISKARQSDFLLDVLLAASCKIQNIKLLIIGDGVTESDRVWLREEIGRKGLQGKVEISGWMPQLEGISLLASVDVGLSPIPRGKLFDVSSPTKAVEYLACGIPCVGNDIPDQQLVINQSAAGLCVPMTVESFVSAIEILYSDKNKLHVMSVNAKNYVRNNRNYNVISHSIFKCYQNLLSVCK